MKKFVDRLLSLVSVAIFLFLFLAGCGGQNATNGIAVSPYDAVYSNLVDKESQEILMSTLKNAGAQQLYIDTLLDSVNKYNNAAGNILPVQDGFEIFTKESASAYNATKLERKWKRTYKSLMGRKNCRITAFEAMGSLISFISGQQITEPLMLVETDDSSVFQTQADIEKFSALFNGIEVSESIDSASQADQIKANWEQNGISFQKNSKISLISIWFNGPDIHSDNERYILHCGHAAVLIHTENDEVLLLEKLDYNFPYQLIRFPSEESALKYIVDFNCGEVNDDIITPVVLVNDQLLRMANGFFVY